MSVLKFKGKWRDYQERILDNLAVHLSDKKIHIVAAPGAGKTTLGIEVISQIDKPTLILTPTITIKNQWKQRIIDAFLENQGEDILSTNIREPKFITISTYQALLAAFCDSTEDDEKTEGISETADVVDDEEDKTNTEALFKRFNKEKADEVIKTFKKNKIKLFCFDEAHHLRNEWWKALDYLNENIEPEQTVALTATPPYDVDGKEWERYENLCGPIDEMISIPELVLNGDLCPHQDYIHFSLMRKQESNKVQEYITEINSYVKEIINSQGIVDIVYKYIQKETEETILDEPKLYMALCSFLKRAGSDVPKEILDLFDVKAFEIPPFNVQYQKLFLNYIFNSKDKFQTEAEQKLVATWAKKAREVGILQRKTIFLNDSPKIKKAMANSLGKLDSIKEIVELEVNALHDSLRMVILADYIKEDNLDCSELGVIPIWQTLKERTDIMLGVLTGSIILIPSKIKDNLTEFIKNANMEDSVSVKEYERDTNFLKLTPKGTKKSHIVELITEMFNKGFLTVLVGTQALLGEGWDAPCINSLILSSTVSSYMLSNQMRGRAIRIDKNNPDKISNIWHLASIKILNVVDILKQEFQPQKTEANQKFEPLYQLFDFNQLKQRFQGFQAPSIKKPFYIENGIERILPDGFAKKLKTYNLRESDFIYINKYMVKNASNRDGVKSLWFDGRVKSYNNAPRSLKSGVKTELTLDTFSYKNGYFTRLFLAFGFFGCVRFAMAMQGSINDMWMSILITIILNFLVVAIIMIKPTIRYLRCSSPERIMTQIGYVFLETLSAMGLIRTNLKLVSIDCEKDPVDSSLFFSASNLTPEENNLLIKSILEFINPIENPRYLFVRKDMLFNMVSTTDYHAMPNIISQNKKYTAIFQNLWQKYIGKCDIIYTRNYEGRKKLIYARKNSYSDLERTKESRHLSRFE